MKVFLDANIIITVINKEYPLFSNAAKLMSLSENRKKRFSLFTSPVCLAIAFYFAEKKFGAALAKKKLTLLTTHLHIANCGNKEATKAAEDPQVLDYEDGLEYYSALHAKCSCIVTEDIGDFYFSRIEILNTEDFLMKYVL